jgi:hypothetical protein
MARGRSRGVKLDCRQCEVICERVVLPWRCLKAHRTCIYAYEEGGATYFGCLHKVFSPELDIAAFKDEAGHVGRRGDPYGPLRVVRAPRPQCPVGIERAYCLKAARDCCVNPGFYREAGVVFRGKGE